MIVICILFFVLYTLERDCLNHKWVFGYKIIRVIMCQSPFAVTTNSFYELLIQLLMLMNNGKLYNTFTALDPIQPVI